MRYWIVLIIGATVLARAACGDDSTSFPRPTPLTRPEMKQALEDMKVIRPRIPLPELTAEEKARLDERAASYEGRLRSLYLPAGSGGGGRSGAPGGTNPAGGLGREQDPKMTLDYAFKTELFWIVSRANNCHY